MELVEVQDGERKHKNIQKGRDKKEENVKKMDSINTWEGKLNWYISSNLGWSGS